MKIPKLFFVLGVAVMISGCETLSTKNNYYRTSSVDYYQPVSSYIVTERRYVHPYYNNRYQNYEYRSAVSPYNSYYYRYDYSAPRDPFRYYYQYRGPDHYSQYHSYWHRRY